MANNDWPKGTLVKDYAGREIGHLTGTTSRCTLEGCTGLRVHIKPIDGSRVRAKCCKCFRRMDDGSSVGFSLWAATTHFVL